MSSKVELPLDPDEAAAASEFKGLSEKCEFTIEGMTCGACVEVSLWPIHSSSQCAAGPILLF